MGGHPAQEGEIGEAPTADARRLTCHRAANRKKARETRAA
jgi:hypothetical protein